jgi:hypothetical protein
VGTSNAYVTCGKLKFFFSSFFPCGEPAMAHYWSAMKLEELGLDFLLFGVGW